MTDKKNVRVEKEYLELIELCQNPEFDIERAKHLISLVDVNAYCGEYGYTLLSQACDHDNFEMVKLLVEAGADVNQTTCFNDSKYNDYNPVIWELKYDNIGKANSTCKTDEEALEKLDEDNNPRIKIIRHLLTHGAKVIKVFHGI